ncbi:MAG: DUF3179 domain-containing protein [Acidobacteriaceae bacterium]|nr:DUF3179 domain-containing protein [Acidobacteriaceae bacterium]
MTHSRLRLSLSLLAVCTLISIACFAFPVYVIWPFRHQGPAELQLALFVKRVGPWVAIICSALCLFALLFTWKSLHSRMARTAAVILFVLALGGAFLSRVNIYEQMFHPIEAPRFESAANAKLDPNDMVIAVRVSGVDHAYPIREMAYHHVFNDTLNGEPIVATY